MPKIAIIRCEKNMDRCPLTGCFRCLQEQKEGFAVHDETELAGVFTCHCPGDDVVDMARILKSKGAEVIHFCTCLFSKKGEDGWNMSNGGFCEKLDDMIDRVHRESGVSCVKGSAHLPKDYKPRIWR